ncbi:hypothetical protein GQ44DRAFT_732183 [Phaeosphaeriaceae sp. PMI808]|nr:hypothetical protein GQ44DRAFT_732183 [Phaeosphaeriaceae sp. PMI808]
MELHHEFCQEFSQTHIFGAVKQASPCKRHSILLGFDIYFFARGCVGVRPFHTDEPDHTIPSGETAAFEVLTDLKEKGESCNTVVVSSFRDLSQLIGKHANLVRDTVSSFSFQGGWEEDANSQQLKTLIPSMTNTNNLWDPEATKDVHNWLRQETIPTFTATRDSARNATVDPRYVKGYAIQGQQVAQYIYNAWCRQEERFYNSANQEDPKKGFLEHMDLKWFVKRVLRWHEAQGEALPKSFEEIVPYLDMVMYDLIAGMINPL